MTEKHDKIIPIAVTALSIIGLLMVLSVSSFSELQNHNITLVKFFKQVAWIVFGFGVFVIVSKVKYRYLQKYAGMFLLVSFMLLFLVLILGARKQGAQRWFDLGLFNFQPTMLSTLGLIIYTADRLSRKRQELLEFKSGLFPFLVILIPFVLLLLLQPDFSSAFMLLAVIFFILLMSPIPMLQLAAIALFGVLLMFIAVQAAPYRMARLEVFSMDLQELKKSQVGHALIAFGSGGFLGEGYAASKMKLFFLQAADTDFILAILGEEFGFLGFALTIFFFLILFWRGLRVASRAQDMFQYYCAIGLTALLFINFAINMGVVLKIFPPTGIPLPFISYGGSHILVEFMAAGLLFNLSQYQTKVSFAGLGASGSVRYASRLKSKGKSRVKTGKKYVVRKY